MQYTKVFVVFSFCLLFSCRTAKQYSATPYNPQKHFEFVMNEIRNPSGKVVLVAAHRGDWRNAPENSIQALKNAIAMGVDIVEFDIRRTRDGEYIVLHDDSLNRNTTGKGMVADYTLNEIKKLKLKDGLGQVTNYAIPTFEEMMMEAKGKIVVDIDKGYKYFTDVIKVVKKLGMFRQSIVNVIGQISYDSLLQSYPSIPDSLFLMPVIGLDKPGAWNVTHSYQTKRPLCYQFSFQNDTSLLLQQISKFKENKGGTWYNSLWPNLCAGHNDDKAVLENMPEESWGWLINKGATIIQTDRPKELLQYLKRKNLHP